MEPEHAVVVVRGSAVFAIKVKPVEGSDLFAYIGQEGYVAVGTHEPTGTNREWRAMAADGSGSWLGPRRDTLRNLIAHLGFIQVAPDRVTEPLF